MQVPAHRRRLAQRGDQRVVHVVDLDRGEAEPLEPGRRSRLAHEARQVVAGGAVAVAAEVDPGQHDLAVALLDAAADLGEHRIGAAAARGAAHERDHAERAGEAAAVLHLDERADAVEARIRLDAADRADVACDVARRLLAPSRDDDDVVRKPGERIGGEVRSAAGDVDAPVRARRARGFLARLRHGLVRDAAGVDHRDVGAVVTFRVPVREQPLAHVVRVDVRDLAAEEADGEARHGVESYSVRCRTTIGDRVRADPARTPTQGRGRRSLRPRDRRYRPVRVAWGRRFPTTASIFMHRKDTQLANRRAETGPPPSRLR